MTMGLGIRNVEEMVRVPLCDVCSLFETTLNKNFTHNLSKSVSQFTNVRVCIFLRKDNLFRGIFLFVDREG